VVVRQQMITHFSKEMEILIITQGQASFTHKAIISAVNTVEFISDMMSYIILKGHWCDIIVLNVHAPTEDESDHMNNSFYKEPVYVFDQYMKHHMKILLGNFNAKAGRDNVFKPTIRNESLHEISHVNRVRVVNFATSKNLHCKKYIPTLLHS
jgi:hypothetical protein